MSPKPPNEPDLVPGRSREALILAVAAGVAGAVTGAVFTGLVGPAQRTPPLTLKPYVDPSWTSFVTAWMARALETPFVAATLLGVFCAFVVLVCDGVLRRAFLASKPGAAALAAVILLVAPAWGAVVKLDGHWGILPGGAAVAGGFLLLARGGNAAWLGAALTALAGCFHPAWLGAALVAPFVTCSRRPAVFAAIVTAAVPLVTLFTDSTAAVATLGFADRLAHAARDLAAAPVLAFSPNRRFDIPTGYETLTWTWPVTVGLAVHALLLGVGMMIGGVRRGATVAIAAAGSVVAAAKFIPGWIPGDRAFALVAMASYAPLAALVFAALPQRVVRGVLPGLTLGVGVVAVLLAWDRAPNWTALGAAMDLPRQRIGPTASIMAVEAEQDPARLVLFINNATLRDAYAPSVVEAADKLLDAKAPALFPQRLKDRLDFLMNRAGKPRRTPELKRLYTEVMDELKVAERLWGQSVTNNLEVVGQSLVQMVPKALELAINWSGEVEGRMAAQSFLRMARSVNQPAARAGYYDVSLPLLEAIQLIGPESDDTAMIIGNQRIFSGDVERGREEIRALLKKLPGKSPLAAVGRGIVGMTLLKDGDAAGALKELQSAWSVIGLGGVKNVSVSFTPETVDYYVVAEILLARYEAAKAVDPALAPQAARDLAELLDAPLRYGVRRLPALAIMGRLEYAQGNRDKALQLLREARRIPSKTLEDRMDGPVGRIAHPRYRRMALETLLAALIDDPNAAAERDEIGEELRQLDAK